MADVRSLLKHERATRRIDHPQASYTGTGTLECSACKLPLKSDIEVWNRHLKSTQHAMRAERLRISAGKPVSKLAETTATSREISNGSKKRKADDDEDDDDSRKRSRPQDIASSKSTKQRISFDEDAQTSTTPPAKRTEIARPSPTQVTAPPPPAEAVDEDEYAAFEALLAHPASPSPPLHTASTSALTATANITAAPLTAAELAAQSREEASMQSKERREAEVEGEKEDAARALEQEFDEMEGLEERVRRLREQREKLREKITTEAGEREGLVELGNATAAVAEESEDDEDDDEDLDEWGTWHRK